MSLILQLGGQGLLGELAFGLETAAVGSISTAKRAIRAGDAAAAAVALETAQRYQPRDRRLPRLIARHAWLCRDYPATAEAYLALEVITRLKPDDARRLVTALRRAGRLDQAEAVYNRYFDGETADLAVLTEWARLGEHSGDLDLATTRWMMVLAKTEATSSAERLSQLLDRRGLRDRAEAVLKDFLKTHPRNLAIHTRLAERLRAEQRHAEAVPYLESLSRLTEGEASARWRALAAESGVVAFEKGSVSRAAVGGEARTRATSRAFRAIEHWRNYAAKGLEARARLELVKLTEEENSSQVRISATWALAELDHASGPSAWASCFERLREIDALGGPLPGQKAWMIRLLTDAGQLDAARTLAREQPPRSGADILAAANLAAASGASPYDRLALINLLFEPYDLAPLSLAEGAPLDIDRVEAKADPVEDGPLVSVIVPTWNAAATLGTAVKSLLAQSWRRLEVLIVDDASTDDTPTLAAELMAADPRVRLLQNPANGGPYVARNLGLQAATGVFVTCHDADDWAHPQRLERQAQALQSDVTAIANMTRCVTVLPDLTFASRVASPEGFRWNFSSLMFRRTDALAQVGYWDEARFGADGEYVGRLRRSFGPDAVRKLNAGPLALVRQSATSLTGQVGLGLASRGMSIRTLYRAQFERWHRDHPHARIAAPGAAPAFSAPAVIRGRMAADRFDVVLASDFRLSGGTTASNVQEIMAQTRAGLRTGLLHLDSPILRAKTPLSQKVLEIVDGDSVHIITSDQTVRTRALIIRWPPAAAHLNTAIGRVLAPPPSLIVNQTPWRGLVGGELIYEPAEVDRAVHAMFGQRPCWRPIGPAVRAQLEPYVDVIDIAGEDWVNVVDLSQWQGIPRRPLALDGPPVIGRHARDFRGKWPMNPADLLAVYPDDGSLGVRILGGAEIAEEVVGRRLARWQVIPFDGMAVADYLESLDVFVYFPDPSLEEAFGRAILEAMASGTPVILPHRFEPVFGDAALYCRSAEVSDRVRGLTGSPDAYEAQSRAGLAFAKRYGHTEHVARLQRLMSRSA